MGHYQGKIDMFTTVSLLLLSLPADAATPPADLIAQFCSSKLIDKGKLRDELVQRGPDVAPELVALFRSNRREDMSCLEQAAGVLGEIGPRAQIVMPDLFKLVKAKPTTEGEFWRWAYAVGALAGIGKGNAVVEDAFIEILRTGDPSAKAFVAEILGYMGVGRATEALTPLLSDTSQQTRERAAFALRHLGPKAATAVPALVKAIERDRQAYLAKMSIDALAAIGTPDAREALRRLDAGSMR
jgi:HEAT repeat protein